MVAYGRGGLRGVRGERKWRSREGRRESGEGEVGVGEERRERMEYEHFGTNGDQKYICSNFVPKNISQHFSGTEGVSF